MGRKKLLLKTVIAILVIAVGVITAIMGESITFDFDVLSNIVVIFVMVIILIFIINFIIMKVFKNRRVDADLMETRIFSKKKLAEENYLKYFKKVKLHIFLSNLYFTIISILFLAIYIIFGLLTLVQSICFIFFVISGFVFYMTFIYLIGKDVPVSLDNEIKKYDYPKLWEMVLKIKDKFNIKKPIRLFVTYENNAGVVETDKHCHIILGIQLTYLMSEEELENILIHEFAHIHLNHTSDTNKLNKRVERWKNLKEENKGVFEKFASVLFYPISYLLFYDFEIFHMVSSRIKENETDKLVTEKGNKQIYINALAKTSIYHIFMYDEAYIVREIYEKAIIPDDYFSILYNKFIKFYNINKELWSELVVKRIPARIDSHYPFKYRMDLLGVENFETSFNNRIPEIEKLMNLTSELIKNDFKDDYEKARNEYYIEPLKHIGEYETREAEFDNYKAFKVATAYRNFGKLNEALGIYNKLIESNSNNAKYIYAKGTILLSLYDPSGIDFIYKAMEMNRNFLNNGMELISDFCLKMGLTEEIEKTRAYIREHRDFVINVQPKMIVNVKDSFLPTGLDKSIIKEVIDKITKDTRIDRVFMADKIIEKKHRMTIVGVIVKQEHLDNLDEILDPVFDYLDNERREEFFLLSVNYYPAFYNNLNEVPLSLKYQKEVKWN